MSDHVDITILKDRLQVVSPKVRHWIKGNIDIIVSFEVSKFGISTKINKTITTSLDLNIESDEMEFTVQFECGKPPKIVLSDIYLGLKTEDITSNIEGIQCPSIINFCDELFTMVISSVEKVLLAKTYPDLVNKFDDITQKYWLKFLSSYQSVESPKFGVLG